MLRRGYVFWFVAMVVTAVLVVPNVYGETRLIAEGRSRYVILLPETPDIAEQFAAEELQKYLALVTGVELPIDDESRDYVISIGRTALSEKKGFSVPSRYEDDDGFLIKSDGKDLFLLGANSRGTLYAVYAYLEQLGCRWCAPAFDYYSGLHEYAPERGEIVLRPMDILEQPDWRYRIKDIDSGLGLNIATGRQLVDWMGKNRVNILAGGMPRADASYKPWPALREQMLPELRKRGISVELGKHNVYNLALSPKTYFKDHPDWFGTKDGKPVTGNYFVFSTANPDAVNEFVKNILVLIKDYPEMDVFQFWPPDYPWGWSESPQDVALGSITDRHAALVRTVAEAIEKEYPDLGVEFLAYHEYMKPPTSMRFPDNTRMDFCAITRSYQSPIYDPDNPINAPYNESLKKWASEYQGDITLYSYYSKYKWHSLPVVIPHMISDEIRYYDSLGLKGMSMYALPHSWFTYEINHNLVARASWDTTIDVDRFLEDYCATRFGPAKDDLLKIFAILEEIVPAYCSVPGTSVECPEEFAEAKEKVKEMKRYLHNARTATEGNAEINFFIDMVKAMINYACMDIEVREAVALGKAKMEVLTLIRECEMTLWPWTNKLIVDDHIEWLKNRTYKAYLEN